LPATVALMVAPNKTEEITRIRVRARRTRTSTSGVGAHPSSGANREPGDHDGGVLNAVKVDLFRRLFVGRPDVFPIRWENRKAGRAGYAASAAISA
jgi:hypothetical protein